MFVKFRSFHEGESASSGAPGSAPSAGAPAASAPAASSPSASSSRGGFHSKLVTAHNAIQEKNKANQAPDAQPKADNSGAAEPQPVQGEQPKAPVEQGKVGIAEFDVDGRKIQIDLSKPEVIAKKVADLDKGMRKAFAERDALKKQLAEFQAAKPDDARLEMADQFQEVIDKYSVGLRSGNTYKAVDSFIRSSIDDAELNVWLQRQLQHHSYLMNTSQEEREQYMKSFKEKEALEEDKYQVALDKAMISKEREGRETAEQRAIAAETNAIIAPAYAKYQFKDKPRLSKALWSEAREAMTEHLNAGNELTKESVDMIFKEIRASIEQEHNLTADAKVAEVIASKKDAAMTGLAKAVQSPANVPGEDPAQLMKDGKMGQSFLARIRNARRN